MDTYVLAAWDWVQANQITCAAIAYIVLNVMPRLPRPSHPVLYVLWDLVEKLMFLTRDSLPGSWKPLFENMDVDKKK